MIFEFHIRCKERSVINGMLGKVQYCEGQHIFIKCGQKIVPVFPVYNNREPYYPIVAGYCFTIHKVMGQTLSHVTLAFDSRFLSPAVGYVALSRVSSLDNVVPMLWLRKTHFINDWQICSNFANICLQYLQTIFNKFFQ